GARADETGDEHHQQGDDGSFEDDESSHPNFPHTTGMSPTAPNWKVVSALPELRLLRRYQVPSLNQPGRSRPFPAQSPTTGIPPAPISNSTVAPPSVVRRSQVVPRTTPARARPSSVQRSTTGMSPGLPNSNSM